MKRLFLKYFEINTWIIFGIIIMIYSIALAFEFKFIFTDEFYYQSFENKSTYEKIQNFINTDRNSEWLNYMYALFRILIPSFLIAGLLYIGAIIKELKIKFPQLFKIALKAQIVFALNYFLSVILKWGDLIENHWENINNNYHYQSLLVFFKGYELPYWLYYPLQSVNITELIHILILAVGIRSLLTFKYIKSIKFVFAFYGTGLFIWIIFTVFLQTVIYV